MAANKDLFVFSEKPALLAELLSGARTLLEKTGGTSAAVVLGPYKEAEQAIEREADRVFWLGDQKQELLIDNYLPTLEKLIRDEQPFGILVGATMRGKAIAARLAARLNTTAVTDVRQFKFDNGNLDVSHMIFGGGAVRIEKILTFPLIATISQGVFDAHTPEVGRTGTISEVPFVEPEWRVTVMERKSRPPASVDLTSAKKVVCAGRGLANQEDLALVEELARTIGAEAACTRPLAEGLGWLPRERYIGISGATIHPDLYLGVGVSGQAQHMIGMNDSRLVVAINKDQNAPIFAQSDYGIVGDLYQIVPALIKVINARK